jgi:hypothetical protein
MDARKIQNFINRVKENVMFLYLYKIENLIDGKYYIGAHKTSNLEDRYFGSGKRLHQAIEKHGVENFKKTILQFFDTEEEMFLAEATIVNEEFVKDRQTYNMKVGGNGGWSYVHEKGLNRGFTGKNHSKETKKFLSELASGREVSETTKKKLSDNNFSKINPGQQREHARKNALLTNSLRTSETIDKISATVTENWKKIEIVECPYCRLQGRGGTMKRWHFDKCKNKAPLDQLE